MYRLLLLTLLTASAVSAQTVFAVDGLLTEPRYRLMATNAGGPSPSFGTGNQLTAIYAHVDRAGSALYLGVGGNINSGNRIIVFLDSRSGGYSSGNYAQGSGVPGGVNNFNSGTTFNPGFTADFAISIGTDGNDPNPRDFFVNVTELGGARSGAAPAGTPATTTDRYIGSANGSADIAASVTTSTTNFTSGFEIRIPFTSMATLSTAVPIQVAQNNLQFFSVVSGDGGDGFLSNSFLTPAPASQTGNVGDGPKDFSAVGDRDPVSLVYQYPADVARYRLLSTPVSGVRVNDLASLNLVQGVDAGAPFVAQYPDAAPNLFTAYRDTTIGGTPTTYYREAPNTAAIVEPGRGFFWQFYDAVYPSLPSATASGGGTSQSYELSTFAIEAGGPSAPAANLTRAFDENAVDRFYMIGNPYSRPIDPAAICVQGQEAASTCGIQGNLFQAYNPLTSEYEILSRVDDGLGSQRAAAVWQGFFAETAQAGAPTFTFDAAVAAPPAPPFYGRPASAVVPYVQLALTGTTAAGVSVADEAAFVRFLPDALVGWDPNDASKLLPPGGPFALLAPVGERDGAPYRLAVNSLPADGQARTVAVAFRATDAGSYAVAWPGIDGLPEGWTATLRDLIDGRFTDMRTVSSYSFTSATTDWAERFELVLTPDGVVAGEGTAAAAGLRIHAPRPNPARGTAEVTVELGEAQHVRAALYDALGRRVLAVADAAAPAGTLALRLDVGRLAPGVYVLRVEGAASTATQTVTVVR